MFLLLEVFGADLRLHLRGELKIGHGDVSGGGSLTHRFLVRCIYLFNKSSVWDLRSISIFAGMVELWKARLLLWKTSYVPFITSRLH